MRLVGLLPERFHGITREFAKFGTIGVVNVAVNFAVYNLLLNTVFQDGEVKAKAVATIVATTSAYFMNRHWTYRDRPKSTLHREYVLFFATNLVGLVIETGTVWLTKYVLHQTDPIALNIAALVGIAIGTVFRFWAYRTHVFRSEPAVASVPVQATATVAKARPALAIAPISPVPAPRVVVSAVYDGTVVLQILGDDSLADDILGDDEVRLDEAQLQDEIELDAVVALADEPSRTA